MLGQHLVGTNTINSHIVGADSDRRRRHQHTTLVVGNCTNLAQREEYLSALDYRGCTLLIEERNQRLARAELHNCLLGRERRIGAEGLRSRADSLLILRREGAQSVLNTVTQLTENLLGDIGRRLGHEIDAHTLRTDQANNLLDLIDQRLRRTIEQHMSLIEEEDQLGQLGIAHLGQILIQLRQQPQQEG